MMIMEKFKVLINSRIVINLGINSSNLIDKSIKELTNIISNTMNDTIPTQRPTPVRNTLPENISQQTKHRNALRRIMQKTRNSYIKTFVNETTREIKEKPVEHNNKNWGDKFASLNTKEIRLLQS